jgi:hypothetical protein
MKPLKTNLSRACGASMGTTGGSPSRQNQAGGFQNAPADESRLHCRRYRRSRTPGVAVRCGCGHEDRNSYTEMSAELEKQYGCASKGTPL